MLIWTLGLAFAKPPAPQPEPEPAPAPAPAPVPKPPPAPKPPPPGGITDEQVKVAIDALYGRPIPASALCIERPTLSAPLSTYPIAVATKRGERGCVLAGVMIDGVLVEPALALGKATDPVAFAKLDTATKTSALLSWTDAVLLAFDTPSGTVAGTVTSSKGTSTVTRRLLRRSDRALGIDDISLRYSYDAALKHTVTETVNAKWQTNFFSKSVYLEGIAESTVVAALTAKGALIADCFDGVWATNPSEAGRVVFEWKVAGGKADGVTVETSPSEVLNKSLASCYGRHIAATTWPAEATGRVRWSFAAVRGEIE